MAPLLLHLRDELIESHFLPRNLEEIFEEQIQTAYLILNQCYVAMTEGLKILQEFGVSFKGDFPNLAPIFLKGRNLSESMLVGF
jgi:hypothetical protein